MDYGDLVAVDHLSLEIPAGEIYGLVGPNGAGKTSTFRVLATLMRPTYGEVAFCGLDLFEKTAAVRRLLGYMPDLAPAPSDIKVWEFLDLFAAAYGLRSAERKTRIVAVSDDDVELAVLWAYEEHGLTVEPGGAAALAAVLADEADPLEGGVIILSGGNIDPTLHASIVFDGL